jgi:hypothetical protein
VQLRDDADVDGRMHAWRLGQVLNQKLCARPVARNGRRSRTSGRSFCT